LPSIASPTAGNNHHQADDINASPPAGNHHASPPACNHQDFEATTAPVDGDQVEEELSIALPKPSKPIPSRPKTSNKFGRGKRRGGDRKTTLTIDTILPAPQAADMGGVAGNHSPAIAKKSTKKQLIRSLNKSEKKRQMTEDKMVVVTKNCIPPPMIARLWQCWLKNEEGRGTWLFNMPIPSSLVCVIR
jgi:hypothetical protein